jgi:hypothetical protein
MAETTIAQFERLFKELALQIKTLNDLFSQSWVAVEHVRELWREIEGAYKEWVQDREPF